MSHAASPGDQQGLDTAYWTVGPSGLFRVLTYLDAGDREIDTDDRAAVLHIRVEMLPAGDLELVAEDVVVILDFDFSEMRDAAGTVTRERANILFHGKEKGPLVLVAAPGETISPGQPLERQVTIRSGLFSTPGLARHAASALPGQKWVDVVLKYRLRPGGHHGSRRARATATMQLCVAED